MRQLSINLLVRACVFASLFIVLNHCSGAVLAPPQSSAMLPVGHLKIAGPGELLDTSHGSAVRLPDDASATIALDRPINTSQGSFSAWIEPLWVNWKKGTDADPSHTFFSMRWTGVDSSYLALSLGWWEPTGSGALYFVLSNQDFAFCSAPAGSARFFAKGERTMITATWSAGEPGYLRLYVDGERLCQKDFVPPATVRQGQFLRLGSDEGATDQRHRPADFIVDSIRTAPTAMSDSQVRDEYIKQDGKPGRKWMRALIGDVPSSAVTAQTRMIFDEDTQWANSRDETRRTIERIKAAGFNVFVPCVWHGVQAYFSTDRAPLAPAVVHALKSGYDPLTYLIETAHQQGIEVHPWFEVMRKATDALPEEFSAGAPAGAFNVHNERFRQFIDDLMLDVVRGYAVDGLNLDYIRSVGVCIDETCRDEYQNRYNRSLVTDRDASQRGRSISSLNEWNWIAVTSIIHTLSESARRIRSGLRISIDTIPFERSEQGLDEAGWLRAGYIDAVVYMAYENPLDLDRSEKAVREFGSGRLIFLFPNYSSVDGNIYAHSGTLVSEYVQLVRSQWPGSGVGFYHYPHLNKDQITGLKRVFSVNTLRDRRD